MTIPENEMTERLYKVLSELNNPEECKLFFEDLCTIKEILDMSQRLETAQLLKNGLNYKEIATKIGVSSATVSRVNKCLQYGDGGYNKALDLLKKNSRTK